MTTTLFWDIDGTLINSGGAGRLAMQKAIQEISGSEVDLSGMIMAGLTDWSISAQILQNVEMESDVTNINKLLQAYQKHLPASLKESQGYILEGILDILESLEGREEVVSFLLTGNREVGAWLKLSHYNLQGYFRGGGFCEETYNRNDIAARAINLAQTKVNNFSLDKCYVIGDTPHDVRCGQFIGAKTIAIASSGYNTTELAEAGSWLVWDKFPAPSQFLQNIDLS